MKEIEKAFESATAVLFGKPLFTVDDYGAWLKARVKNANVVKRKSRLSGKDMQVVSIDFFTFMGDNVVTLEETVEMAKRTLSGQEAETLTVAGAPRLLQKICTTSPEIIFGENFGTEGAACYGMTQYCYRTAFCFWSKKVAYSFWNRECDSIFGCSNMALSSHCLKCHSSTNLQRCFEVNDSSACSGCYFCHNCENLQDCMFCFNAKGLRYAVGNVQVGREAYMKVKALLCGQMHDELSRSKRLGHDIFNVGAARKCARA